MVIAPQKPKSTEPLQGVSQTWKWLALGLIVVLVLVGVGGIIWLLDGDEAADPGPVGPVGPQEPVVDAGPAAGEMVIGSGLVVSEARTVPAFRSVTIAGEGTVVITQADQPTVVVETDDNLLPLVTTNVEQNTLTLDIDESVTDIEPSAGVKVVVGMSEIEQLAITGVGSISTQSVTGDAVIIELTGVGSFDVRDLDVAVLDVNASGAGSIVLDGEVDSQTVVLAGTVGYDAEDLRSVAASVRSDSSNVVILWVTDRLDVSIRNLGSVEYYGMPEVTSEITGSGTLRALGDK